MKRHLPTGLTLLIFPMFLVPTVDRAANPKNPGNSVHSAAAIPSERLGTAAGWTAYTYKERFGKVCYIVGGAEKSEPPVAKRKEPMAMVTHRPGEKIANVVSFDEGYTLKEGSEVSVDIDGTKFDLFTKDGSAWARTSELDKTIVEAMAKGKQAVVKGTPQRGVPIADTYSLAGFAQALAMIDKACEIKR